MRYLSAHYIFPVSAPPLKNGVICIDDNGTVVDLIDTGGQPVEREKLIFYNGILVPGFVNAHCHLELSHLRKVMAPHLGLPGFLSSIGNIRKAADTLVIDAASQADHEMHQEGIVAVGDISNCAISLNIKKSSNIKYRTFVEVFGLDENRAETIFAHAQALESQFLDCGQPAAIVPHAMYSVSAALFGLLGHYYAGSSHIVSMHHQESEEETTLFPQGRGALAAAFYRSGLLNKDTANRNNLIREMEDCLANARKCLLVHNSFASEDDIRQRLQQLTNIYWVLCPCSNLYIQNRLPNIPLFTQPGLKVCLGTDSLASNTRLSIIDEMKTIHQYYPEVPLTQLLEWATLNGAQALGFDDMLGSFDVGKKPGINLLTNLDLNKMQLTPQSKIQQLTC